MITQIHFSELPLTLTDENSAVELLHRAIAVRRGQSTRWVCFLNAHNFNQSVTTPECAEAFKAAIAVFPDGIALRVAARLLGIRITNNLPGTDLVPAFLEVRKQADHRVFLLGDTAQNVNMAADEIERKYPGWKVVGARPGYFDMSDEDRIVNEINASSADLLLVGMGTPRQESFIYRNGDRLSLPLVICVGGLFSYWTGRLVRAPGIFRALNVEWLWILIQQPHKWRRYMIGTAQFFAATLRARPSTKKKETPT